MLKMLIVLVAAIAIQLCQAEKLISTQRPFATVSPNVPDSSSTEEPQPKYDLDYFDNEDFAPYKDNRHDEFDWKLTKAMLLKDETNVIVSPFSVKLLLSLLAEAAGRETSTHKELSSILPSISSALQAREHYGKIFGSLQEKSSDYDLRLGTRIYLDLFIEPRQRFAAIVESFYFTKVQNVDFSKPAEAANTINQWCSEVTENQIQNLVSSDDVEQSVMLMVNAIYFNGYWRRPFPENETAVYPFYVTPTQQANITYMTQTGHFYYLESKQLDAKILRMPYRGRKFAMTVILPNSKGGLNELIRQMETTTLHRAQWLMDEVEVKVTLPKFKFDHTALLNDILKELGIRKIFTNEASLPQMVRGADVHDRLKVSKVLQKAGIYVNENGSTVYAATVVELTNKFGGDNVREFNANRPFVFLIEDETTGTLLFSGKYIKPEV